MTVVGLPFHKHNDLSSNEVTVSSLDSASLPPEFMLQNAADSWQCVNPSGGNIHNNVKLDYYWGCDMHNLMLKFRALDAGDGMVVLQSVADPWQCVHPGEWTIRENVPLVFHFGCDTTDARLKLEIVDAGLDGIKT